MIEKIMEDLNKFAPETVFETTDSPKSASWIIKEIKNAIVKRDKLFQK